ncbi:tol-pal system protein YbgF [Aquabacterium sp.]|uniref:tol-pal system protein YbgF n=1 Tax=Aquabacterium sp. TaxID=1872578 RepID=UPI0035B07E77
MSAKLMLGRVRPWVVAIAALGGVMQAQAGIFDDDEARRAILELREQRTRDQEQFKALESQIEQLKSGLLDMNARIEQLRQDLASQRGDNEVLGRDLSDLQRRQKDLQQSVDDRVRKLEPQTVTVDGKTFQAEPDEKKQFEDALTKLRQADFDGSAAALQTFLKRFPTSGYYDSGLYWLGNAQYGQRNYKDAMTTFRALLARTPDQVHAPEAMLSISSCQTELKDTKGSRKTLEDLVKQYPKSEAAQAAKDRLTTLGSGTAAGKSRKD